MARFQDLDAELIYGPLSGGIVDTVYDEEVPHDAVAHALGFHWRKGYPYTEHGRAAFTGAEVQATKRNEASIRWPKPDGSTYLVTACNGGLWIEGTAESGTPDTLISVIDPGGTAAVAGETAVTVSGFGTNRDLDLDVRTGDYFFIDSDGHDEAKLISAASGTSMTVAGYDAGALGAYSIWRKLSADVDLALCDEGILITDAAGPMHWYGETYRGSGVYHFREVGLPTPAKPTHTLAAGGHLTAGTYVFGLAFEDAAGRIGPMVQSYRVTATADQKLTWGSLPAAPIWAKKYVPFSTRYGGDNLFRIWQDIDRPLKAISESSGTSDLVRADNSLSLVANRQIGRYAKFNLTGTEYRILANDGDTIKVLGDATGEGTDDYIEIAGGIGIENVSSIEDLSYDEDTTVPDRGLDLDKPAPSVRSDGTSCHAAPPVGLSGVKVFRGGGYWSAHDGESRTWFSGRPLWAQAWLGEYHAKGQFHHCSIFHDIEGGDHRPIIAQWVQYETPYIGREDGIWMLDKAFQDDIVAWEWRNVSKAVGVLAKDGVAVFGDIAWLLGTLAGKTDIIRFNGQTAQSIGQAKVGRTLDGIKQIDKCTGAVFDGMYWLSYTTSATGGQVRTLRYYFDKRIFDKQGWGCGPFIEGYESGDAYYLLCAAPDSAAGVQSGHIYRANGPNNNHLGAAITRELYTANGAVEQLPSPAAWQLLHIDMKVS